MWAPPRPLRLPVARERWQARPQRGLGMNERTMLSIDSNLPFQQWPYTYPLSWFAFPPSFLLSSVTSSAFSSCKGGVAP